MAPYADHYEGGVGPVTVTEDLDEFIAALRAVKLGSGGDCPEPALTGLMRAIEQVPDAGALFLFTDASLNDPEMLGQVTARAVEKHVIVIPTLLGSCSPYSKEYFELAERTGGQVFVLAQDELDLISNLSETATNRLSSRLNQRSFELTGEEQTFEFLVDESLEEVAISVSGVTADGQPPSAGAGTEIAPYSVQLENPEGQPVLEDSEAISVQEMTFGSVIRLRPPQPGTWTLRLNGTGRARVVVDGIGTISLVSFQFLTPRKVKHGALEEAYFPIEAMPIARESYLGRARMRGNLKELTVEFRSLTGDLLSSHEFDKIRSQKERSIFTGEVTVPSVPFTVHAMGSDAEGRPVARSRPACAGYSRRPPQNT